MRSNSLSSIVRKSVIAGAALCGTLFAQAGGGASAPSAPAPAPALVKPAPIASPEALQPIPLTEDGAPLDAEPQQVAEDGAELPPEEPVAQEAPPVVEEPQAEQVVQETPPPVEQPPAPPQIAEPARAQSEWDKKAKNIITVDFGPTILAVGLGQAFSLMNYLIATEYRDNVAAKGSGFGIGLQYARRLPYNLAAAVRFDYLTTGPKIDVNGDVPGVGFKGDYQEFNFTVYYFEGHFRYYPLAKGFFVDGNASFGNVILRFEEKLGEAGYVYEKQSDGRVLVKDAPVGDNKRKYAPSVSVIKLGPAFGLSETLGENGGFTVEVSFGYQFGIPVSKTITDRMVKDKFLLLGSDGSKDFFDYTEKFLFMGGPRLATSVGWSF